MRAHNDFLQTIAELGLVGGMLIAAVLGMLIWREISLMFMARQGDFLSVSMFVLLGGIAVNAVFSFPLQLIAPLVFIAIYLGLLIGLDDTAVVKVKRLPVILLVTPLTLAVIYLNFDSSKTLERLDRSAATTSWQQPAEFNTLLQHPMFAHLTRILAQRYQTAAPQWAENIARGFYSLNGDDVVINNTLALALVFQKQHEEAEEIIAHTLGMEPKGYYRSYENEIIMATNVMDRARLSEILEQLDSEPRHLLTMQQNTLVQMAKTASNLGDLARAEKLLRENLALHPRDFETHRTFLLLLTRSKRVGEAEAHRSQLSSYGLSEGKIARLGAQ